MNGGNNMKKNIEICTCSTIHEDVVEKVRASIPQEETLYDLAELFKVLEIVQGLEFFVFYLKLKCVFVI